MFFTYGGVTVKISPPTRDSLHALNLQTKFVLPSPTLSCTHAFKPSSTLTPLCYAGLDVALGRVPLAGRTLNQDHGARRAAGDSSPQPRVGGHRAAPIVDVDGALSRAPLGRVVRPSVGPGQGLLSRCQSRGPLRETAWYVT